MDIGADEININDVKRNYRLELLSSKHDLSNFNSLSEDLNEFLKEQALFDQKRGFNITQLIIYKEEIIGFFSLLNDSVPIKKLEEFEKAMIEEKTEYKNMPAMKLGRYALDKKYVGKGLGTYFLINIIKNICDFAKTKTGIRFITVDGYANAYRFYDKNNFKAFKSHKKDIEKIDKIIQTNPTKTISMYQDIYPLI